MDENGRETDGEYGEGTNEVRRRGNRRYREEGGNWIKRVKSISRVKECEARGSRMVIERGKKKGN